MDSAPDNNELTQAAFGLMGQFTWLGQEVSLAAHRTIVGPLPLSNRKFRRGHNQVRATRRGYHPIPFRISQQL